MDNDPKYEHWIDRMGMGIVSGRNIPETCTSEVKGVDGAKSAEASPVGRQDFFRGATERDCDEGPRESTDDIDGFDYDEGGGPNYDKGAKHEREEVKRARARHAREEGE